MCLKDKVFWSVFLVKGFYTTIGVLFGVYIRLFDTVGPHSIKSKSSMSYMLVLGNTAFFTFEFTSQIFFDIQNRSIRKDTQVHHILTLVCHLLCIHYDASHHFFCFSFTLELIVPVQSLCWTLKKLNMQNTFSFKAAQFIFIHLFHIRSAMECFIVFELFWYYQEGIKVPVLFAFQAIGVITFTFVLTPFWIYSSSKSFYQLISTKAKQMKAE